MEVVLHDCIVDMQCSWALQMKDDGRVCVHKPGFLVLKNM